jgi:hypothetical protein
MEVAQYLQLQMTGAHQNTFPRWSFQGPEIYNANDWHVVVRHFGLQ